MPTRTLTQGRWKSVHFCGDKQFLPRPPAATGDGSAPLRSTCAPASIPPSANQKYQHETQVDALTLRANGKVRLRQLISKVNTAALPGPSDLAALDGLIRDLIALNPTPNSATSDLINGRWVLLYTANSTTLQQAAAAVGSKQTVEGGLGGGLGSGNNSGLEDALSLLQLANNVAYRFFYTYVPLLAGAAVGTRGASSSGPIKPRGNFQVFDTRQGIVENQARFDVGGRLCCVNVNGTAEVTAQSPTSEPRQRLRAVFTSFDLVVDGQPRLSLPLSLLNPVGFVDTPYLDEEIRISVGDKGSVFIAAREVAVAQARLS